MSVIIAALILRQTITAVAVIGVIVVSLAGTLLVWASGGDCLTWLVCECMFYRPPSIGMPASSCQWACSVWVWKVPTCVSMMVW